MATIVIPTRPSREFLETSPYLFVYGTSVHNPKAFGQATNCLGLDNCFGIPVRWSYCRSNGFFSDNQFRDIKIELLVAISKIPLDTGKPIIVLRKLGEGNSRMNELAPKAFAFLHEELDKIKYHEVRFTS